MDGTRCDVMQQAQHAVAQRQHSDRQAKASTPKKAGQTNPTKQTQQSKHDTASRTQSYLVGCTECSLFI